jgi:hypothetical protein
MQGEYWNLAPRGLEKRVAAIRQMVFLSRCVSHNPRYRTPFGQPTFSQGPATVRADPFVSNKLAFGGTPNYGQDTLVRSAYPPSIVNHPQQPNEEANSNHE